MSATIAPPSTSVRTSADFKRIVHDAEDHRPGEQPAADEATHGIVSVPAESPADHTLAAKPADGPAASETRRIVVEADEIVFKAGGATFTLRNDGNGTIEIAAGSIVLKGEEITSAADQTHTTKGTMIVSEAAKFSDLLGKLIRINGQCVKINC
jgi:hypothetical protein